MEDLKLFDEEKKPIVFSINLNNYTKKAIQEIADEIILSVSEGNEDAIDTLLKADMMNELSAAILKGVRPKALKDAKELKSKYGVTFSVSSGRKTFSFDHDEEWCDIKDKINFLERKLKEREELMIKAMEFENVTTEGGVVVPPAKFVKQGDDILRVTVPK